ncbi:cache domain-containing protein [uncultured Methylobacterium sp.]|uniref:cache domain-containing protein n=1 Tax=uncultured Methylobacterium sp. TaxID=157278 RepID=UPI0035CA6309
MRPILSPFAILALAAAMRAGPVLACGFVEAPVDCGEGGGTGSAQWMLKRVVAAIDADKPKALATFTKGEAGFRTADTYVFCVGPDGMMTAHPSPILQGHDVRDLHDSTGNHFIARMLETAKPGEVSVIRYLFPKPGGTVATQKTTYYTRASDQMCGVGVYDADAEAAPASAAARIAALRQRLDGAMPANLRSDWTAFLEALNANAGAQNEAMARARASLHAAEDALAPEAAAQAANE